MKSLIATALLLCSQSDAALEETSLMQGLMERHSKLSVSESSSQEARQDATAKLMETATKMMKNGATPDVITFIETTITEVNQNILGAIVDEHDRDQALIDGLLERFDIAVQAMQDACAAIAQKHTDRNTASMLHKQCRQGEAIDCAKSRRCEEELEHLWGIVRREEAEMRRIHWGIHGEWCLGSAPEHPSLADPFHWTITEYKEGAETSESVNDYPQIDLENDVIEFRRFSVEYFGHYIVQKPKVEEAWSNYNRKLIECADLEDVWGNTVETCDDLQNSVHDQACEHASHHRQSASTFGHEYHMTLVAYNAAVTAIQQLEYDRKREWETLHITTCLLQTVYTHVIHSIDSGEPCPTTESHPNQTETEINYCHVVEESLTTNLTIDYGNPPPPVLCPIDDPGPCTAQYIWDEHGSFLIDGPDPMSIQNTHVASLAADEGLENYMTTLSFHGWAGCAAPKACIPCDVPDLVIDPAYTSHDDCMVHQEYLRPGQMDHDTFRCQTGNQCIFSSGRCNGESNCDDGSDEVGCVTTWGVPAVLQSEVCQDPFVSDVQFRCADDTCTHIEGRCNGVNNCADGSDEEGCSPGTTGLTIEATTGYTASIEVPTLHSEVFYDRQYTFDSLGSFSGYSYVKMANEDKHIRHSHVQMKLRLPQPLTVNIVRLDDHELPWLHSDGWTLSNLEGVSYHGVRSTRHTDWSGELNEDFYGPGEVWQKTFPAGVVELRGNSGGDGSYVIFVAHPENPPTPPPLYLWDQHLGDHHKCNNNMDMQYVSSQQACQQLAVANGHEFYSFRHNAESSGHKCMSSATCDSPLDGRTNTWNIYSSNSGAAQYVGCFKDDGARDLGAMVGNTNAVTNTFQACRAACGDHQYMSLQFGGECFCANSYGNGPQYTQEDDGLCNSIREPCFSNSFNCGGTWHQAIYQINPVTTPPVTVPVLQNGDFEAGRVAPLGDRGFLYTSEIAGWTASGQTVAIPSNNGPWGGVVAGGGSFFLGLQRRGASVSQTVGGHMVGRTYKLKFTTAQRTNSPGGRNAILRVTTNNAEKINEVVASLAMETREVTYTAEASDVEIKFENVVASADQTVFIDAVEITEA